MKHKLRSPPRIRLGKPRSPYRASIGKRESPSPAKKRSRAKSVDKKVKPNSLPHKPAIVCGVCILNYKDFLDRNYPVHKKTFSIELCAFLFQTVLEVTKTCPYYCNKNKDTTQLDKENSLQTFVRTFNPQSSPIPCSSLSTNELPILDHIPLQDILKDTC